jgi:DNA polymerase-3 subunit alpha
MSKIISRQSLGIQPVYDIGVEKDHNFLLGNGLVAANCFNKSHSTAYAYVTYQTAYLKANYPTEYMTALLTASSDSQEKVEKYRENCQKMGINVYPPDINHSQKDFTPWDKNILFGFSAVRNLGDNAIENILQAREAAGGKFASLADFCSRVDLRVVNRRALETLIYCGAFDKLHPHRKPLIDTLEMIISWAQKRAKEKESGQLSIFDVVLNQGENKQKKSEFEQAPSIPNSPDYSLDEKLKYEKENLGFYVSEHPLKPLQKVAEIFSPVNISDLLEQNSRKLISAVIIVTAIKKHITKKGDPMAFIGLEDISGQVEGIVFPQAYARIQQFLLQDATLMVWGKVQKDDDKVQLIIEDAEPVDQVKMVMVNLSLKDATDQRRQSILKSLLQERSGEKNKSKVPVIATIGQGQQRQMIRLGQRYWVQDDDSTVIALNNAGFSASSQPLIINN